MGTETNFKVIYLSAYIEMTYTCLLQMHVLGNKHNKSAQCSNMYHILIMLSYCTTWVFCSI